MDATSPSTPSACCWWSRSAPRPCRSSMPTSPDLAARRLQSQGHDDLGRQRLQRHPCRRRGRLGITVMIVAALAGQSGSQVLPKRWVVERALSWISRCRRTAHDDERRPEHHAAFVQWSMIIMAYPGSTATTDREPVSRRAPRCELGAFMLCFAVGVQRWTAGRPARVGRAPRGGGGPPSLQRAAVRPRRARGLAPVV